jgi:UDP-glucuronate decarboxylase
MRVLITGGSGFIGLPLLSALKKQGHTVLALSRRSVEEDVNSSVTWLRANLNKPSSYQGTVNEFKPEVLIYLAWQDIPDFSFAKSQNNLHQSLELISYVVDMGSCKKILVSGSCFEANQLQGQCEEINKGSASNDFTWAKNAILSWLEMKCKDREIKLAWMRIFYVYGPRQRIKSLIPTILTHLKKGELPDLRTPNNANDFIYIDDVVDAFIKAVTTQYQSSIFNLGSGNSTPVIEVCRIAEKIVLKQDILTEQLRYDTKNSVCDVDFWADTKQSKKIIKWQSSTTLGEGIEKTWDWLQKR